MRRQLSLNSSSTHSDHFQSVQPDEEYTVPLRYATQPRAVKQYQEEEHLSPYQIHKSEDELNKKLSMPLYIPSCQQYKFSGQVNKFREITDSERERKIIEKKATNMLMQASDQPTFGNFKIQTIEMLGKRRLNPNIEGFYQESRHDKYGPIQQKLSGQHSTQSNLLHYNKIWNRKPYPCNHKRHERQGTRQAHPMGTAIIDSEDGLMDQRLRVVLCKTKQFNLEKNQLDYYEHLNKKFINLQYNYQPKKILKTKLSSMYRVKTEPSEEINKAQGRKQSFSLEVRKIISPLSSSKYKRMNDSQMKKTITNLKLKKVLQDKTKKKKWNSTVELDNVDKAKMLAQSMESRYIESIRKGKFKSREIKEKIGGIFQRLNDIKKREQERRVRTPTIKIHSAYKIHSGVPREDTFRKLQKQWQQQRSRQKSTSFRSQSSDMLVWSLLPKEIRLRQIQQLVQTKNIKIRRKGEPTQQGNCTTIEPIFVDGIQ